jgi:hypothetical protein
MVGLVNVCFSQCYFLLGALPSLVDTQLPAFFTHITLNSPKATPLAERIKPRA